MTSRERLRVNEPTDQRAASDRVKDDRAVEEHAQSRCVGQLAALLEPRSSGYWPAVGHAVDGRRPVDGQYEELWPRLDDLRASTWYCA